MRRMLRSTRGRRPSRPWLPVRTLKVGGNHGVKRGSPRPANQQLFGEKGWRVGLYISLRTKSRFRGLLRDLSGTIVRLFSRFGVFIPRNAFGGNYRVGGGS